MIRTQVNFSDFSSACIQAMALSNFYNKGRWCVYAVKNGYRVVFDECKVRDGIDESDILFEAESNCNSETKDYITCRDAAFKSYFNID